MRNQASWCRPNESSKNIQTTEKRSLMVLLPCVLTRIVKARLRLGCFVFFRLASDELCQTLPDPVDGDIRTDISKHLDSHPAISGYEWPAYGITSPVEPSDLEVYAAANTFNQLISLCSIHMSSTLLRPQPRALIPHSPRTPSAAADLGDKYEGL